MGDLIRVMLSDMLSMGIGGNAMGQRGGIGLSHLDLLPRIERSEMRIDVEVEVANGGRGGGGGFEDLRPELKFPR